MSLPKRILVVDDDDDDREVFLEVVSELDATVISNTAINGADGLEKLTALDSLPSVIFLDLNMPIMNGTEFLRKVKSTERLKNIPIVIFTTISDKWAINEVRGLGAADFITKPVKFKDWQTVLRPFIV